MNGMLLSLKLKMVFSLVRLKKRSSVEQQDRRLRGLGLSLFCMLLVHGVCFGVGVQWISRPPASIKSGDVIRISGNYVDVSGKSYPLSTALGCDKPGFEVQSLGKNTWRIINVPKDAKITYCYTSCGDYRPYHGRSTGIGQRASHASRVNVHGYNLDKKQNSKLVISAEELGFLELAG